MEKVAGRSIVGEFADVRRDMGHVGSSFYEADLDRPLIAGPMMRGRT
jgi:hypothetical protein